MIVVGEQCVRCGADLWIPSTVLDTHANEPQLAIAWCLRHGCGGSALVDLRREVAAR